MLSGIYLKLIGGVLAAVLLAGLIADRGRWMHRAHVAEAQVAANCQAVRDASNNPKLSCEQADEQIKFLGQSVQALSNSLKVQNDAVASMGDQTKQQQTDTAKASQAAQPVAQRAEQISIRLDASSKSPAVQQEPCEPSAALKGAWQ